MKSSVEHSISSRYFVVKSHQWRGNLKRIFIVSNRNVATAELSDYKVTNNYEFNDIRDFFPVINEEDPHTTITGADQAFSITFPNGKMKFKTKHRADILTDLFQKCTNFSNKCTDGVKRYECLKHRWSNDTASVLLDVGVYGISKIDKLSGKVASSYNYRDVYNLYVVNDCPLGPSFVISTTENERHHLFTVSDVNVRKEILEKIRNLARRNIGVVVPISPETLAYEKYLSDRLGVIIHTITPFLSFLVVKNNSGANATRIKKRQLLLTEEHILERDVNSNEYVNLRWLHQIYAIVRAKNNSQLLAIQYLNGDTRYYTTTERDELMASLLDRIRTSGNVNVQVKIDASSHKIVHQTQIEPVRYLFPHARDSYNQMIEFFNENCYFGGLVNIAGEYRREMDKCINLAISELLLEDLNKSSDEDFNNQLVALKYLFTSRAGFAFFLADRKWKDREIELLFKKVKHALDRENDVIIFNAIDMLSALMQPMQDETDLYYEQKNKGFILCSERFLPILLELLKLHIDRGTGALIISSILDFLTYALCAPYSETTDGGHFDFLLENVAKSGRCLFKLFNHKSFSIVKATCLLMKAVIEEGISQVSQRMQDLSLSEGTFLFHLHTSLYPVNPDQNLLQIQVLSRKLLSLWTVNNDTSFVLLNQIFPLGLLNYLESKEAPPRDALGSLSQRDNLKIAQSVSSKPVSNIQKLRDNYPAVRNVERQLENAFNHWRHKIGLTQNEMIESKPTIVLRRRREFVKSNLNWDMFFYQFTQSHSAPDLIWNHKTREELREALEKEIHHFKSDKELFARELISWNFDEFEVRYHSLSNEIKIGNYYLRLLLTQENSNESNLTNVLFIKNPNDFFNNLYHRFLSNSNVVMKCDCLHAMAIIYSEYHDQIGCFDDVHFLISTLQQITNRALRDRIIKFFAKLIKNKTNIKSIIDNNGILLLIDFAALAHLHVNRAVIPTQSNVIEASPDMMNGWNEKEWHISEKDDVNLSISELRQLWEAGKITRDTKCWAQGYNTWRKLESIVQLKWTFMGEGSCMFQENDLTILILNILIEMCSVYPSRAADGSIVRPVPKVKRMLTDDTYLPHIIHLLLTFDPIIVEKVATLVYHIMEDNPRISLLYQTGLFYFILMYTGSNILPISRLLHLTHMKQSFKSDDSNASILHQSILAQMLPEAMVCFLQNYGPEHFSKVFLGEFDTPEVIWNNEMRRFMIERIAAHIVDFSPRLQSNVRAFYQYCPIPPIRYAQLENELFCNIYYLKNLCDTKRFANWEIKDPIALLKDILDIWKKEISKEPNTMAIEDALAILKITDYDGSLSGPQFESLIRKQYYAQAQLYHPDKNANGREMFEKVNAAYYFLCSDNQSKSSGPDVQNIILILKAQSILFALHNVNLHAYKYAGYPMLLKTLKLEADDSFLFSKPNPLLGHACKVVYYSVKCSALNAEELRREQGLELLYNILNRCVSMLSASSKPKDLVVKVCRYIISCFGVSADFSACRHFFYDMNLLPKNIFYLLNYKHLDKLSIAAIDCVINFCADPYLQLLLFKSGVLFSLLQFIFEYDYTLEETEVQADEKINKQSLRNLLAKKSLTACVALFENRFAAAQVQDKSLLDEYSILRQSIYALLTPYIANQLEVVNVPGLLKMLNSNVENPYFIWNNVSRSELLAYLQEQENELLRSGVSLDESYGTQFVYSSHKEELIICDIFVRIYNAQPSFPIVNVKQFVVALLDTLGTNAQYLHTMKALSFPSDHNVQIDPHRLMVIKECFTALINLIKQNASIETSFIGNFKTLFSFLRLKDATIVPLVLQLIMNLSTNKDCLASISNSSVVIYLALLLHVDNKINEARSKLYLDILEILLSFASNSDLVKECFSKGIILYAINLFIANHHALVREKAAQVLIRFTNDKQNGEYAQWILNRFLPSLFLNAMKDNAMSAVALYDQNQENPELIWTDQSREKLISFVRKLVADLHENQTQDPQTIWKFSTEMESQLSYEVDGELKVAGVYLGLFNQSPGWILSRPKEFLLGLLEKVKELMESKPIDPENLEIVTNALANLLSAHSNLLTLIPPTGYIQVFVDKLKVTDVLVRGSCLRIIHQFSYNSMCVNDLIATNSLADNVGKIIVANAELAEACCDVLIKVFEYDNNDFIEQAVRHNIIDQFLNILNSNASHSTKAKIVQILQCIQNNPLFGARITEILNTSNIWKDYKDQKHDLFITNDNSRQYLTGPNVNLAGYLTQNSANTLPLVPPPLDE